MLVWKLARRSISDFQFHRLADNFLQSLAEQLEDLQGEFIEDIVHAEGVVTLKCASSKTFVINKQSPNKQLWLSSPFSGPKRYEFKEGYWANLTDGHSLLDLITDELNSKFKPNEPINLREPEGSLSNI
mmetsp:Transcript_10647/g.20631  ORF Transcript_10647/g.20631 Transcript_10647/m.20631 type:complete len:129 (+) Transcript_10647:4546-4932(+)